MPVFLPTHRLLAILAAAAPLFLLGTAIGLAADGLILVAALTDLFLIPRHGGLRVERRFPGRISLGATGELEVDVVNTSTRPVRARLTFDLPPILGWDEDDDVAALELAPRGRAHFTRTLRAESRGVGTLGDLHLRVTGPLGLVWRQERVPLAEPVRVQPGIGEIKRYRLLSLHHRLHEAGMRNIRVRGEQGSFESLADYARGDDPRTIDWKATARRATITVRRYEAERSQNVVLALDAGRLMTERLGEWERIDHALAAALLLADVALAHGDRVGVLSFSDRIEHFLPPSRPPLSRIADTLGTVQPRLIESNYPAAFTHLGRRLRRRSLIVIFTDLIDVGASAALIAHLGRSAGRHLPLAVALRNPDLDRAATTPAGDEGAVYRRAAAEELLQARAHALAIMRRAGVLVADARPDEAIPAVVNRYLEVKRRGLL